MEEKIKQLELQIENLKLEIEILKLKTPVYIPYYPYGQFPCQPISPFPQITWIAGTSTLGNAQTLTGIKDFSEYNNCKN